MKPKDRQDQIAAQITREGETSVDTLAARFDVSAETIRRDLARLSEAGRIRKVHGGAKPLQLHSEPSFDERMTEDAEEKQVIGAKLRDLLRPGDTIFIDTGSTTLIASEALAGLDGLTVITNSLLIAQQLGATSDTTVILLGGTYRSGNRQTVGNMVIDQIARFQVDHAVLTLTGLDAGAGVTFSDMHESDIARAMIRRAETVTFLAHASKFGRRAAFRACALDEIDTLLTLTRPPEPLARALIAAEVTII